MAAVIADPERIGLFFPGVRIQQQRYDLIGRNQRPARRLFGFQEHVHVGSDQRSQGIALLQQLRRGGQRQAPELGLSEQSQRITQSLEELAVQDPLAQERLHLVVGAVQAQQLQLRLEVLPFFGQRQLPAQGR